MKQINTPLQDALLNCLFDPDVRGDIRTAMKKVGYSDNTSVAEVTNALKDQIIARSQQYLAVNAGKAVFGMVSVLDNPTAMGNKSILAAANEVLDRVGITKKDDLLDKLPKGAIIYLPPKTSQIPVIEGEFTEMQKIEKTS